MLQPIQQTLCLPVFDFMHDRICSHNPTKSSTSGLKSMNIFITSLPTTGNHVYPKTMLIGDPMPTKSDKKKKLKKP